jgi:RNA polymerase sigma factor for flagellar operon FliA
MPVESPIAANAPVDEAELVRQHLPIVQYEVADLRRRLPEHVNPDDLTSAGMAALALAARSYDPSHGVPFGRYAARRISGALLDELRAHDWASRSVRRRARTHADAAGQLSQLLGRPASPRSWRSTWHPDVGGRGRRARRAPRGGAVLAGAGRGDR